jgi:hypothetical protein
VKLGRAEEHGLQSYLQLLDMIEKSCHQELAEANNEDRNAKSVKILQQERESNFFLCLFMQIPWMCKVWAYSH